MDTVNEYNSGEFGDSLMMFLFALVEPDFNAF